MYPLTGQFDRTINERNEIVIPSKLYSILGKKIKKLRIFQFRDDEYPLICATTEGNFQHLKDTHRKNIEDYREARINRDHRITIPSELKEKCGLENRVKIFGSMNYFGIMDPLKYEEMEEDNIPEEYKFVGSNGKTLMAISIDSFIEKIKQPHNNPLKQSYQHHPHS